MEKIGKTIKFGRIKMGLSQKELAQKMSVNQSQISKWEADESVPTGEDMIKLMDTLEIVSDIFPSYEKVKTDKEDFLDLRKRVEKMEKIFYGIASEKGIDYFAKA